MTNIQFAPETPPGFRRVRRGQTVCCARYSLPKTWSLRIWPALLWDGANSLLFSYLRYLILFYFPAQGGHVPRAPPPGYVPASKFKSNYICPSPSPKNVKKLAKYPILLFSTDFGNVTQFDFWDHIWNIVIIQHLLGPHLMPKCENHIKLGTKWC